ncbi:MAG: HAD family hydrolase, partial [Candidatus Rokuibacteriota bacterium]
DAGGLRQWVLLLRYSVLASDYDGTLAIDGRVPAAAIDAIVRFKEAEGRLVLVTGRNLDDLRTVFPAFAICDLIVAENGGLLSDPATGLEKLLAPALPLKLVEEMRARGVTPILPGRVIVSTRQPYEREVEQLIADLALPSHSIFNTGAVMVLPRGVNKGAGLKAALASLGAAPETVIAVGDAENDHSLIAGVGLGAAVANALQSLRDEADLVLDKPASAGVELLLHMMLSGDPRLVTRRATIGEPVSELAAAAAECAPGPR